jgi:phospholipase C
MIKTAAAAAAAGMSSACARDAFPRVLADAASCGRLTDIEHVVIFIQENRSFDHYFGSYRGVRGFAEQSPAFRQPDPANTTDPPVGALLPFHLNTAKLNAACTHDITHDWVPQHQSWHEGAMDGFVTSRLPINAGDAALTMGYYARADLPFYYAVADAFTICDNYFCSVIGPTDPNRLYTVAASLDPDGKNGGPLLQTLSTNRPSFFGRLTYTTMPEQLEARGISWKVYQTPDASVANNLLWFFKNFQNPLSPLYRKAFLPNYPVGFAADALAGTLPQVSWVLAPLVDSEHPPAPSIFGENDLATIIHALTANPRVWAKTVLFATYDENGGFFDHVPPLTAPPGTPGEYVTAPPVPDPSVIGSPPVSGPIGLGFRVPLLVISPFSRGGLVASDRFDHTSLLRFLETRFGAEVPNLSAWRRGVVGDLTSALNFAAPDATVPPLPSTLVPTAITLAQCVATLAGSASYPPPDPQLPPTQEPGTARRPSGRC